MRYYRYILRLKKINPFARESYDRVDGPTAWPILWEKLDEKKYMAVMYFQPLQQKWVSVKHGMAYFAGIQKTINNGWQGYSYIKFDTLEKFMEQHFTDLL